MIVIAEISPVDQVAGTRKLLRCTTHDTGAGTGVNGQDWSPAIVKPPVIGIRLFKGDFDGTAAATGGALEIALNQLEKDEAGVRSYFWPGAPIKLWAGVAGQAWPWQQVFEGGIESATAKGNILSIQTRVNDEPFEVDALVSKYAGTGGVEGGEDLKERPKPMLVGRCFNVAPILINAVDNVYQVHGYGPIHAVTKLYERGSDFDGEIVAYVGDFANYAALVAATIAPGRWGTCLAQGLIRLGAPQAGIITADVDGDKGGGIWRYQAGAVIQRLCEIASVSNSLIESASFTAIDTALNALPYDGMMGWYQTEQASVLSLAAQFANDVNHVVGVSLLGKLFASPLTIGSPSIVLDAQGRQDPTVYSAKEEAVSPPFSLIEMGYARSWRVHSEDEIATYDVDPATQAALDLLAGATGKVTYGGPLPSVENSSVDDLHVGDDGLVYRRVSRTGILLDNKVIVLAGFRPSLPWTLASSQPIAAGIRFGLQAIDEAQAAADAALIAQTLANDAQATADGKIQTYYQATAPSGASEGDIWIDTDDGNNQYRWTSGSWVDVQDTGIGQAIADAAGAQATADGKVTTFYVESAPTAEAIGDLWHQPSTGYLKRWNGTAWVDVANVGATPDQISLIGSAIVLAEDAQATADGKVRTFYQTSSPTAEGVGDLWFDTDDGNKQYRWSGSSWVAVQDEAIGDAITAAAGAQATADGKVTTFIGETAPTADAIGDLWLKASSGQLRRWSGTSWGDPLADLTAVQQVVIVPPVPQIVYRDWQGNIKSGQYNRTLVPKVERGGVDIRISDDVDYAITTTGSIAATINNTDGSADKGKITATGGSSGSILLDISVLGVSYPVLTIPFSSQDDNPPTTGGGGGGGNTGGSDSTLEDVTSTSFAAITQMDGGESVFLIDITSGQTLHGTAPLTYQKSGTNTTPTAMVAKWQYRLSGDPTWLDFAGSSITGSGAYWNSADFVAETGDVTANQSKASLATGTYEVRLVAAKDNSAAGNLQIISGTATVSRT